VQAAPNATARALELAAFDDNVRAQTGTAVIAKQA